MIVTVRSKKYNTYLVSYGDKISDEEAIKSALLCSRLLESKIDIEYYFDSFEAPSRIQNYVSISFVADQKPGETMDQYLNTQKKICSEL